MLVERWRCLCLQPALDILWGSTALATPRLEGGHKSSAIRDGFVGASSPAARRRFHMSVELEAVKEHWQRFLPTRTGIRHGKTGPKTRTR